MAICLRKEFMVPTTKVLYFTEKGEVGRHEKAVKMSYGASLLGTGAVAYLLWLKGLLTDGVGDVLVLARGEFDERGHLA